MRIVITGAAGRLGRLVTEVAVAAGHGVVACDRVAFEDPPAAFEPVIMDVGDYDAVREVIDGADAVIHLAAWASPGGTDWHRVHRDNVTGSYNVLLAAAEAGVTRISAASSVNAVGGIFSRTPRHDYFPLDPAHPCYAEDPYSLSKWILEEQARAITRRFADVSVACLRFSAIMERERRVEFGGRREDLLARDLWGYSPPADCARVCLTAVTSDLHGAEVFYTVAENTASEVPSEELHRRFYPEVPIRGDLSGHRAFYDSAAARAKLGWTA